MFTFNLFQWIMLSKTFQHSTFHFLTIDKTVDRLYFVVYFLNFSLASSLVSFLNSPVPAAPSGVKAEVYLNSITLQWEKPQYVPGIILAYYIYHKSADDDHETYTRITESELINFKLEGLMGRTKYMLKVCTVLCFLHFLQFAYSKTSLR